MHRWVVALMVLAPLAASGVEPAGVQPDDRNAISTLPPVGDHWVWVADRVLGHNLLFDGDTAEVLGSIPGGVTISPKPPLLSRERGEFYSVEIDYARGLRGERTDYVTIYDAVTLDVKGEVVLPTRTSESAASLGYSALLGGGPTPVGIFPLGNTPEGLCDIAGNVWEWCQDDWHSNYEGAPTDGSAWSDKGGFHVYRGSSWCDGARLCRCALRGIWVPGFRRGFLGFRLVLAVKFNEDVSPSS